MDIFSTTVYAAENAGGQQANAASMISMFLPFVLIIAVMYFLMIRPQKKKEKLKQEMLSQLIVGDRILTIGGIHGRIISIKDDTLVIETGKGTAEDRSTVKIARWAVSEVTKPGEEPKETPKAEVKAEAKEESKEEKKSKK
ncbi:MAG: preprotein translocase subunit YajC [Clostridia bacterium]|nr:preprotein translocase subunit YajC [Clostridia bacterium]